MVSGQSTEQLLVQVALRTLDEFVHALGQGDQAEAAVSASEDAVGLAFAQLWSRVPRLTLACLGDGLWWDDHLALAASDAQSGFPTTLVTDGIEGVTLEPGAEKADLRAFAFLVIERRTATSAQDLDRMLFRADLTHFHYTLKAQPSDGGIEGHSASEESGGGSLTESSLQDAIRADVESPRPSGVVELESFDSTLYFLDEREIEYLRSQVAKQYSVDQTRSVLALLLDTLELQTDSSTRNEVIEALRAFLPYLLGTGRYTSLAYLTNELRLLLQASDFSGPRRDALTDLLNSVSEKGALTQIFLTLEEGRVTPTPRGLADLLSQLDHDALATVLVWSGELRRVEVKAALIEALEAVFKKRHDYLVRLLSSTNRAVIQSALAMAGRLRIAEVADGVTGVLDHDDAGVRKQAVEVLGSIPGSASLRGVAAVVKDPDSGVRKTAYQVLMNRPYRAAARPLRELVSSSDLEARSLSERKLLFSAFGGVAGSDDVEALARLLSGKRLFRSGASSETRACAALALQRIGTPAARQALNDATGSADPLVRGAALAALRGD